MNAVFSREKLGFLEQSTPVFGTHRSRNFPFSRRAEPLGAFSIIIMDSAARWLSAFLALFICAAFALPQDQKDSLLALNAAAGGPFWYTLWNTSTDPCTSLWHGVTCDTFNGNVTHLDLNSNNLTGSLPDLYLPLLSIL